MSVADNVKQARVLSGYAPHIVKNDPAEYADKQHEFFAGATAMFRKARLRYASDFVEASVQFWRDLNKTATWKTVKLRFANVVRPSSAIQRNFDDYKQVISDDPSIGYLRPGAKIRCMGSTWLVVNPDNISGGEGMAIIRRCNAVWNHLDYFGNIVSEPIIVENARANASSPDTQAEENISTGYFQVTCQYNDWTRQANDNTRIILGDAGNPYENAKAYQITGYGNFFREFTDEANSVRLLTFTIRVLTKNSDTDDLANCVADGKTFSWEAYISGPDRRDLADGTFWYTVKSTRNGKDVTNPETGYLYRYVYAVSDENIARIIGSSYNMVRVEPLAEGAFTLTATLEQNHEIAATKKITIEQLSECVVFGQTAPASLSPFQTARMTAFSYDDTGEVDYSHPVNFVCSGARDGSYGASYPALHTIEITCFGYSETPLTVTALGTGPYEGKSASLEIRLEDL